MCSSQERYSNGCGKIKDRSRSTRKSWIFSCMCIENRDGFHIRPAFLLPLCFYKILRGSMTKQLRATMTAMLVISSISLQSQTSTTTPRKTTTTRKAAPKKAPVETPIERQIRELREQMQSQQAQIDALKRENAEKDAKLAAAQQSAQGAEAAAA